ncbi:MAG: ferrochelatase [Bacteroidetes bacterium]|nr:ferrochelatase [Bacteroidota bacterium]
MQKGKNIGIVLLNLGGPTDEASVYTFLYNLFCDPDIIKLGGGFRQRLLARLIAGRRASKVRGRYRQINACAAGCAGSMYCSTRKTGGPSSCCSPINPLTERQRVALESRLRTLRPRDRVTVYTCMRYWEPDTAHTLRRLQSDGVEEVLLLPLYPQFSYTTSGSSFRFWTNEKRALGLENAWREYHISSYATHPLFLQAFHQRIDEALAALPQAVRQQVHLVFTAHGTPLAEVRAGDPYTQQVRDTVQALMATRREPYWLGFQSRVGPAKWTQPATNQLVMRLARYGIRNLVLVPVAFVTDHIETLMELNLELREELEAEGLHLDNLVVTTGLNDIPHYVNALAEMSLHALGLAEEEVLHV